MTVAPSDIAGHGHFADTAIAAGDVAVRFDDDVTTLAALGMVNHSCDPNSGWTDARTLVVLRDVEAGAEFTVDYATCVDDPSWTMYCHCDTYRCRQLIEGGDWAIPQLQRRYAGHWAPHVQLLIHSE